MREGARRGEGWRSDSPAGLTVLWVTVFEKHNLRGATVEGRCRDLLRTSPDPVDAKLAPEGECVARAGRGEPACPGLTALAGRGSTVASSLRASGAVILHIGEDRLYGPITIV